MNKQLIRDTLSLKTLLFISFFLFASKQIIYGLTLHTFPSSIFTLCGLVLILFIQITNISKKSILTFYRKNKVPSILLGLNLFICFIFFFIFYFIENDPKKLLHLKSLNLFWILCFFLPLTIHEAIRRRKFNPQDFFDKISFFICYFGGSLFILESILVRFGHFNRLQLGNFLLGLDRLYIRYLWGFLGNETQSTGLIAICGLFLLARSLFVTQTYKNHRLGAWAISAFSLLLGMSIMNSLIFFAVSLGLITFKKRKKKWLSIMIILIFLVVISLSPIFTRLIDYLTVHRDLVYRLLPEFYGCNFSQLLVGTHIIEVGCRARDVHLIERLFQTNLILFLIYGLLVLYPLRWFKKMIDDVSLIPFFTLYCSMIMLSLHYDLIASWAAAFLSIVAWSILTYQEDSINFSTKGGSTISLEPFTAVFLSTIFSIGYIVWLDIHKVIDLPLFKLANIKGLRLDDIISFMKIFTESTPAEILQAETPSGYELTSTERSLIVLTEDQKEILLVIALISLITFVLFVTFSQAIIRRVKEIMK